MAIETGVLLRTRGEIKRVEINGVPMLGTGASPGVLSCEWGDSYDQPPWLNVELNTIPNWMRSGMDVKLYAGIVPDNPIQFTGFISALPGEEPEFLRDKIILDGAVITIGTPPDTSESPLNAVATLTGADIRPALPSGSHIAGKYQNRMIWDATRLSAVAQRILTDRGRVPGHPAGDIDSQTIECAGPLYNLVRQLEFEDSELDVGGMTDLAVIAQELDRCGITDRIIDTPPLGAYTLAADATIDGGSGIDRLQDLVGIASPSGLQFHQTPGGTTLLRTLDFFPAPTAAFEYSTDDPDTAYITDTSGVTELAVTFNPTIRKGMTGQFTIPHLNVDGRYFVYGVRHVMPKMPTGDSTDAEGSTTYLRLRGGNRLGGTVAVNPVAAFTFSIRRQVINDRVYVIVTFDASDSVALDGTITTYAWSDNRVTTPEIATETTKVATVRIDPAVIPAGQTWDVTLTVTASNGLTHATTLSIPTNATESAVVIAPFGVAGGIRRSISPNGGETYNNTTPSSKTATAIGARPADGIHSGHFAVGHSDGTIDVTRDFGVTYTAATFDIAAGSQINYIGWDWRNTILVWAITENGLLYLSNDAGVSFFRLANFRTLTYGGFGGTTAGAILNLIGMPFAGGIYVFGGTGAGVPLVAFNTAPFSGGAWIRQTFTGDLLTDITTPADATMRIEDFTAPGDGLSHMILSWASGGGASLVAIYSSPGSGDTAAWTRATGLTAGLKTGRVILSDAPIAGALMRHAMFADRDTWHTTNGIAWTQTTNVLPAGYTPNHGLFESDIITGLIGMQDVFLVAAENAAGDGGVFKSVGNGFTVLDPIYGAGATYPTPTYPVGEKPAQIAIGAVAIPAGFTGLKIGALLTDVSPRTFTKLETPSPLWSTPVAVTGITANDPNLFCPTSDDFFVTSNNESSDTVGGNTRESHDAGLTWASDDASVYGVARAADGKIWRFRRLTPLTFVQTLIDYSTDDGATWTNVLTLGNGTSQVRGGIRIACHPTNPNIIAVWGSTGFTASTQADPTVAGNWTTYTSGQPNEGQVGANNNYHLIILANNRLVWAGWTGASTRVVKTSDNFGSSWTDRFTESAANNNYWIGLSAFGSKVVLFRDDVSGNGAIGGKPVVSTDSATSFAELAVDDYRTAIGGIASGAAGCVVYDGPTDTLVISLDSGAATGKSIFAFSPVTVDGVWSNITFNLASNNMGKGNLAVIP